MFKAIKRAIRQVYPQRIPASRFREELRHQLALIGGQLLGSTLEGSQRLLYVRDQKTVVWKQGQLTTYYQFTPQGLIKSQNGQVENASDFEARRLLHALRWYRHQVFNYLKKLAPQP